MVELIHGDCLEKMKDIPDGSVDMVLTDPPYGTTACKWDTVIPFEPMWEQLKRVTKKNGAIVLFGSQPFTSDLVMSNVKMFKYEWVWEKTIPSGMFSAKYQPMKKHENILVFGNKKVKFNPIKEKRSENTHATGKGGLYKSTSEHTKEFESIRKETKGTERNPTTVLSFPNVSRHQSLHPTQKPVALFEYLIKTYTNEGDLVLDNCAGSGTTGVACININRNYILIEKEPKYIEVINKRLSSAIGS